MNLLTRARTWTRFRSHERITSTTAAPLTSADVQRGLRLSIIEGTLSSIHINVTGGAFLTGFALLLGAGPFELGVIGALPFVSQLFQFVGAYLEERFGNRRQLILITATLSRSIWAVIALLPFLIRLGSLQLFIFLMILMISYALIGIAGNAWTSWMSDLVPARQRGRYFGIRNTICSITAMGSTWLAGYTLDSYRTADAEPFGYALIFGVAVVSAVAGMLVLSQKPEPPKQLHTRISMRSLLSEPMRNHSFLTFTIAATGWGLVTGIAVSFFNAYGLQTLQLSFATLALLGVAANIVGLIGQPLIGRAQDRFGDKPVLVASAFGVVLLPWGWILSSPESLMPLWLTQALCGILWPGINQGMVNLLMDRTPSEGRGAYVAFFGAVTGSGSFIANLLGGTIAAVLGATLIHIGP